MEFTEGHVFAIGAAQYPVEINGVIWPSIEHAFCATRVTTGRDLIRRAASLNQARTYAKLKPQVIGWSDVREEILLELNRIKVAQHKFIEIELAKTEGEIVHINLDMWLGCNGHHGANTLGRILEHIRSDLHNKRVIKL